MDPDQGLGNHVILVGPGIADPCHLIEIGSRVVDLCIISFGPWSRVAELCHFVGSDPGMRILVNFIWIQSVVAERYYSSLHEQHVFLVN